MKHTTLLTTCIIAGTIASSQAALTLVNGDFETGAADSAGAFPAPWYSGHPTDWQEFRYAGLAGNPGTALSLGFGAGADQSGYVYQLLGTYSGETTVSLAGTAYNRLRGDNVGDFDVSFYFGAFAPVEGTDVAGSTTQLGSTQQFEEGVNLPGLASGTAATSSAFSHTASFAGSGISTGDQVWVRLGDGTNNSGNDEPYIDTLVVSTVPEPSSTALLGLGGLALILRRKK